MDFLSIGFCKQTNKQRMTKFFTAEEGSWRVGRESRKEPAMLATSLSPSKTLKIGTWNIRKTFESGKTAQVAREMHMYSCRIYNQEMHHLMVLGFVRPGGSSQGSCDYGDADGLAVRYSNHLVALGVKP